MRDRLQNAVVIATLVTAVATTAMTVRRELLPSVRSSGDAPATRSEPDWLSYASSGHVVGPDDASVTMVVFADFQCSFCRRLKEDAAKLRKQYPEDVRLIFRHYPLWRNPYAIPAARASECAADQGRFEAMHDALFDGQSSIGAVPWSSFARSAGVQDLERFGACMGRPEPHPAVERDMAAAKRLGVKATPTVLIDGVRIDGAPKYDWLVAHVGRARAAGGRRR